VAAAATQPSYSRKALLRVAGIAAGELRKWEKLGLVPRRETYGFRDLLALRTIAELRKHKIPVPEIARAVRGLASKLRHIGDPLTELRLYADGKRIRVEVEGHTLEAGSGQLLFNFDHAELNRMLEFRAPESPAAERQRRAAAERWFQRGVELEQSGAPAEQVIAAYQQAIELDPRAAGAMVNLGTLHFHARNWREAERYYKLALEADPDYPLAHFDLANLYDERGDRQRALEHYQAALRLSPNYADAHYNLALLYQGSNQPMRAARHWTIYLKLDPASAWANIARRELAKLRAQHVMPGGA
jgi:tetratricopeptide (TPR) repeat protein